MQYFRINIKNTKVKQETSLCVHVHVSFQTLRFHVPQNPFWIWEFSLLACQEFRRETYTSCVYMFNRTESTVRFPASPQYSAVTCSYIAWLHSACDLPRGLPRLHQTSRAYHLKHHQMKWRKSQCQILKKCFFGLENLRMSIIFSLNHLRYRTMQCMKIYPATQLPIWLKSDFYSVNRGLT